MNSQKAIYVAANPEQAHMLKNALEEQGIAAWVSNEPLQVALGDLPAGMPTAARVMVDEENAEAARDIAMEFEDSKRRGEGSAELTALDREHPEESWPTCPHCSRRRHTSCPICETAGTEFEIAFMPGAEGEGEVATQAPGKLLVLCPICDEAFRPKFPSRCEWCGHWFTAESAAAPAAAANYESEFNGRVWFTIIALLVVMAGVWALFAGIAPQQ